MTRDLSYNGAGVVLNDAAPRGNEVVNLWLREHHGAGQATEHGFKCLVVHSHGTTVGLLVYEADIAAWQFLRGHCFARAKPGESVDLHV